MSLLGARRGATPRYAFREHLAAASFHVPCYEHIFRLIIYPIQSFLETWARYVYYVRVMLCGSMKYVPSTKTVSKSYTREKRKSEAKIHAAELAAAAVAAGLGAEMLLAGVAEAPEPELSKAEAGALPKEGG